MTPIDELQSLSTRKKLFGMCMNKAKNRYMAEELFQNTMEKAVKSACGYEERGKFGAWLANICHTTYVDMLRWKRYRGIGQHFELVDIGWMERNGGEFIGEVEVVWEKIGELTDREKEVIEMVVDGETYEDMAEKMGVKMGNLKSLVNRTKKKLAGKLGIRMLRYGGYKTQ